MFVKLIVEGRSGRVFFQVIVVEATSVAAAKAAAIAYLAADRRKFIAFDDECTAVVDLARISLPRLNPPIEGVVAASGCIWIDAD